MAKVGGGLVAASNSLKVGSSLVSFIVLPLPDV